MRYLPLTLGMIIAGCTPPNVPQQVVVDIQSVEEKDPLLIIPKPMYEFPGKKTAGLDLLIKNYVEESIKRNITFIEFDNFSGQNLVFERIDNEYGFIINLWDFGGDTLQLYGDHNGEGVKVTYNAYASVMTLYGQTIVTTPVNIDPHGPLRKPLTDLMETVTEETKKHRLMEGVYASERVFYPDKVDSPKFAQACTSISSYVLSNK